jgi:hypothetical protein
MGYSANRDSGTGSPSHKANQARRLSVVAPRFELRSRASEDGDEFHIKRGSTWVKGKRERREVSTMAATIDIEIESGVFTGPIRQHRGYYAGDFSQRPLHDESD